MKARRGSEPQALVRVLDANFNRAIEGCRVIEDTLRLSSRRPAQSQSEFFELKTIRHRLSYLRARFGVRRLVKARCVAVDPGAYRKHREERRYRTHFAMLVANLQRVKESLRVIEEVGRAVPASGRLFENAKRLRFRTYELEEHLLGGGRACPGQS